MGSSSKGTTHTVDTVQLKIIMECNNLKYVCINNTNRFYLSFFQTSVHALCVDFYYEIFISFY